MVCIDFPYNYSYPGILIKGIVDSVTRFSNIDMIKDPRTKEFCENGDTFNGWIGPDVHFLFSTIKNGSDCCWVLTHKDEHDIDE